MIVTASIFQILLIAISGIGVGFHLGTLAAAWKYQSNGRNDEGEDRD